MKNKESYLEIKRKEIEKLISMLKLKKISINELDDTQKDMLIGYYSKKITSKKEELEQLKKKIMRKKVSI